MQIDRILYPITTLGPGERLVIWTVGCTKHCFNCANPELWSKNSNKDITVNELINLINININKTVIDGVTITGGDPLEQITELCELLPLVRQITDDLLIYTGYTVEELKSLITKQEWKTITSQVSVLIDGEYIEALNDNNSALRGSTNQNIIYFDETKKELYSMYIENGRSIQNVFYDKKMISVGIHNREQII